MNSQRIIREFAAQNVAVPNADPVIVTQHEFGAPIEDYYFQLSARALGVGGDWTVDYRPTPTEGLKRHKTAAVETDSVLMGVGPADGIVANELQVSWANLGAGAAPILTVIGVLKSI